MRAINIIAGLIYILFVAMPVFALNQQELAETKNKALAGDIIAQVDLGDYYDGQNCQEALKWYKMAAEQGQFDARMRIATYYVFGRCDGKIERNILKGYVLYSKIQQQYTLYPESQKALDKQILDLEQELTAEQLQEAEKQINMPWSF